MKSPPPAADGASNEPVEGASVHLPTTVRVGLVSPPIHLPRWPADVEAAARDTAETVPDHEVFAFWMGCTVVAALDHRGLERLAQSVRVPVKRRKSTDRSRTWVVEHWPRLAVQNLLPDLAARSDSRLPKGFWTRLGRTESASAAARLVHRELVRPGIGDGLAFLQPIVAMRLARGHLAGAYDLLMKDSRVRRATGTTHDGFIARRPDLKAIVAGLHFLHDRKFANAVGGSAEAILPQTRHELAEDRAAGRQLRVHVAVLEAELASLKAEMADMVALYEDLLAPALLPVVPSAGAVRGPLAGRRVVIAGDPPHREGYVALCRSLGASEAEFLDGTT